MLNKSLYFINKWCMILDLWCQGKTLKEAKEYTDHILEKGWIKY